MFFLDGYRGLDGWMWIVAHQLERFVRVVVDGLHIWVNKHDRHLPLLAAQLEFNLFLVVGVDVNIAALPNEVTDGVVGLLCKHESQQCVGRDVEWPAKEGIQGHCIQ